MRIIKNINENWAFVKDCGTVPAAVPADSEIVNLPHTWNGADGQDGGNNYLKGAFYYVKNIVKPAAEKVFIEVEAAANASKIFVNGIEMVYHEGGYSAFRADITETLQGGDNTVAILVDNTPKDNIYPQMADFTFYGGLYRNVNLITVMESHFDLEYFGGNGFEIASTVEEGNAIVNFKAYVKNPSENQTVEFLLLDAEGKVAASASYPAKEVAETKVMLLNPHLWQGVEDPYLYTAKAMLVVHNEVIDEVSARHGIRTYSVDPQKGFFLNGTLTPLRGVSRHQDLLGAGNALTKEEHYRDMEFIREIGANTIRLAHYQHSQHFFDACDEAGMVVWAEIPFISVMNKAPAAHDNCISQMKELIVQNCNHSSICFWGIANEITIGGESPQLIENLKELDRLTREMDPSRLTTIAQVSMVPVISEMNRITQTVSYNHYFGWYGGTLEQNESWLDDFHQRYPEIPIGLSEYGAEGIITYHNDDPKVKDYSEDYQALYHEHMAKIIEERPWLWATHVWNMFDFGCDARDEGGVKGRNNKGLMTLDRKIKKDSFYVYKAFWSKEGFVHICGHRYAQRKGSTTTIKVYSNQPSVELFVNGKSFEVKEGYRIFIFENVPLEGLTMINAKAGEFFDAMSIEKVAEANQQYILVEEDDGSEGAANWFNPDDFNDVKSLEFKEGYFSIKDSVGDVLAHEEAGTALIQLFNATSGMKIKKSTLGMFQDVAIEGILNLQGSDGSIEAEAKKERLLIILNEVLGRFKK